MLSVSIEPGRTSTLRRAGIVQMTRGLGELDRTERVNALAGIVATLPTGDASNPAWNGAYATLGAWPLGRTGDAGLVAAADSYHHFRRRRVDGYRRPLRADAHSHLARTACRAIASPVQWPGLTSAPERA
jgi:hypothetical protein